MDLWHGDEPEIEADYRRLQDAYQLEHADDWKYDFTDEEE